MSSHAFTLSKFYKDMGDVDPDFRQTGLWDLSRELEHNGAKMNISDSDQDKIMTIVTKSLNEQESHSDVHANAIQVLVHLTPRIRESARFGLINDLARCIHGNVKAVVDPRFPSAPTTLTTARIASLRDNAGIALKNMIEACRDSDIASGEAILRAVFAGFDKLSEIKQKSECLDVGSSVIKQFKAHIKHEVYAGCFAAAKSCIDARDWGLRRRALLVVAQLSLYIPQDDFNHILEDIISGLNNKGEVFRNRAQLASAISQRAGSRFAARVKDVLTLLSDGISKLHEDDSPESDDIRENILHAYEHIVCQCAGSVSADFLAKVIEDCVRMLDWDPNFACDDPLDDEDMPLSQDSEEIYEGMMCREGTVTSFDEVVDESDDSSWKVRRAAAHSLSQIIRAKPNEAVNDAVLFSKLFKVGNPVFLTRLRDRVESVQQEVCGLLFGIFEVSQATGTLGELVHKANPLVRTLLGALKGSVASVKPNIGAACLSNLRIAFTLFSGAEWQIISKASGALQRAINSPSFASPVLKPEAMRAACAVVQNLCDKPENANTGDLAAVFNPLAKFILDGAADRSIKTSSTAVSSTAVLVRLAQKFAAQVPDLLQRVFVTLEACLAKSDADHEVKRTAIDAVCELLTHTPASDLTKAVSDAAPRLVKVTIELSKNDGLRSSALPMLALTAQRLPLEADAVKQIVAECVQLLKKADRQVREGALRSLNGVLSAHGAAVGEAQANEIVKITAGIQSILSESELFLAVLCLQMLRAAVLVSKPAAATLVGSSLLTDALNLTRSALQQATGEISEMLAALVRADPSLVSKVLQIALGVAENTAEARALPHVAQVLAAIVGADIASGGSGGAKKHLDDLVSSKGGNKPYAIPLFGELGRNTDLSKSAPQALTLLKSKLESGTDEEKTLASTALGRVASSAHNQSLLAELLSKLSASGTEQAKYFVLRALREAVNSAVHDIGVRQHAQLAVDADAAVSASFSNADTAIAQPLLALSGSLAVSDESVTIPLVSECLGRTALLLPEKVVPMLIAALSADAPEPTALCVTSGMRFVALASAAKPNIRPLLGENLAVFIATGLENASYRVRRAALLLLATGVQLIGANAFNVKNDMTKLLKLVAVDKSLQQSIDVGLFVHVKDAGLEMRRAAFEAVAVLCQPAQVPGSSAKVLPITNTAENHAVVTTITNAMGLTKDESEPELHVAARNILLRLVEIPAFASEILGGALIDRIGDSLRITITSKVKDGADADATKENARSAAVMALKLAPRAVHCTKLADACKAIKTAPLLGPEYDSLVARAKEDN